MGNQPHSVSLNLSLSLYHSFCLSCSWQLNLAMNLLVQPDEKNPRNMYFYVVIVMFRCKQLPLMMVVFMSWSSESLDIILPTPA